MVWIILGIVVVLSAATLIFLNQPEFGKQPSGKRLERIKKSPHYKNGSFQNITPTQQLTTEESRASLLLGFAFRKTEKLRPDAALPAYKTNLKELNKNTNLLVWFGHSSYLLQMGGKRFLIDPVFVFASPVSFLNKPFNGTAIYQPQDMPNVDYLIITHDHWDHLDYKTITYLKDKTGKVITGLGVGAHLEHWGFQPEKIIELDWNEEADLADGLKVFGLPARHFSGRGLKSNQTIWSSFLLQSPTEKIYIGGDSGYDTLFANIGNRFPGIDLAILENGQYDKDWKYIHLMPEFLGQAAKDLKAKKILTVHHSKFALARHAWDEPLQTAMNLIHNDSLDVLMPMIGEVVYYNDTTKAVKKWW